MRILITGICGFVGAQMTRALLAALPGVEIFGIDNLIRPGSELNRTDLQSRKIKVTHGDIRNHSDLESLPKVDWVIDAAANPSVLAGVDGSTSSRQLIEHNLLGSVNLLEYCKRHLAGLVLLSTSRVYSIAALCQLPLRANHGRFSLDLTCNLPLGVSIRGLAESFPTVAPISLYGSTKLASEILALEYSNSYNFPVWINRCGVLAGAGQFGTAEQGVFSYWMHAHAAKQPLRFIGFDGQGHQVRDALHPADLAELLLLQMQDFDQKGDRIFNVGGGADNAISLFQLNKICDEYFGSHKAEPDRCGRPFDIPWVVMDSTRAKERFGWRPHHSLTSILEEIAQHVRVQPNWKSVCMANGS